MRNRLLQIEHEHETVYTESCSCYKNTQLTINLYILLFLCTQVHTDTENYIKPRLGHRTFFIAEAITHASFCTVCLACYRHDSNMKNKNFKNLQWSSKDVVIL